MNMDTRVEDEESEDNFSGGGASRTKRNRINSINDNSFSSSNLSRKS